MYIYSNVYTYKNSYVNYLSTTSKPQLPDPQTTNPAPQNLNFKPKPGIRRLRV